jgi:hypothetical protein
VCEKLLHGGIINSLCSDAGKNVVIEYVEGSEVLHITTHVDSQNEIGLY